MRSTLCNDTLLCPPPCLPSSSAFRGPRSLPGAGGEAWALPSRSLLRLLAIRARTVAVAGTCSEGV